MELRHIRYFLAVAEELHFGRAAERLCIAQPPLSQQIQQLERELGYALLERTSRRVALTEAGKLFYEEARESLANLEKAAADARRVARGESGWLGVGFVGSATYRWLPAILREFRQHSPGVEMTLREMVSARQATALRERRIHVGIARPPVLGNGIACRMLVREPLVAALPADHPLAESDSVALADLAGEPFILFPKLPQPSFGDLVLAACEAAGLRPHPAQEVAEMHTAISLVAAGLGVALVPESLRSEARAGLCYRPLAKPVPTAELALICREGDPSPALQRFIAAGEAATRPE